MTETTPSPLNNVIKIDDERNHLDRAVEGSVEETKRATRRHCSSRPSINSLRAETDEKPNASVRGESAALLTILWALSRRVQAAARGV
jgi:hypothetical protein